MMGLVLFAVLMGALVVGPLVWRIWQERAEDRGLAIRAEIEGALRRDLHGESLLALNVVPAAPWRTGRVEVSVPTGWDPVLVEVSGGLLAHVPSGYELVVQHPDSSPEPAAV